MPIVRLFNPKGPDRVAVVSTQSAWAKPGAWNVQVARGPRRAKLQAGVAYGPFDEADLAARHAEVIARLRSEGFVRAGFAAMMQALVSTDPAARAHAAARLGFAGDTTAVPALLLAADQQGTDLSAIVDALGRLGDARGVALCRTEAARKLLSRRRSGVEALRNLGDTQGLDEALARSWERLPDPVRVALKNASLDDTSDATVQSVTQTFKAIDVKDLGLTYDTLYELATPLTVACARWGIANGNLAAPHIWRYVKSIYKRAMLREDFQTFGWLAHRIEKVARTARGTTAVLKSGLDGQQRSTRVFGRPTQDFMRRVAWRYLRALARSADPSRYPRAAAWCLAAYRPEDRQPPKGAYDEWSRAYLFNRVLRGASTRLEFMPRTLTFRVKAMPKKLQPQPSDARTESFAELWDATPVAYLPLLAYSKLPEVLTWAVAGVKRVPGVLASATHAEVLAMIGAPHDEVAALAAAEVERRFDASKPDWSLVGALLRDERAHVRALGQKFLVLTAPLWTRDMDRVLTFLGSQDAGVRTVAAGLVVQALDEADTWFRRELAEQVLAVLQGPEPTQGAHEGYARVARDGLVRELAAMLTVEELMALIAKGSPAAQAVSGAVLGQKTEAVEALGLQRILAMAQHDVAAVREAGRSLVQTTLSTVRDDPSVLFTLCESEWKDTRTFAFDLLRDEVDFAKLGIDGYVSLCDSNRDDVQSFGRDLILRDLATLDMAELIQRLSQHPAARIRRFALDLVVGHLKEGFVALAKLEGFFRACLFDLWPSRNEKRIVLDFLVARGLKDERQAEVSVRVLGDFVRVKGRADFERALEGLVRLRIAFPEVESRVAVAGGVA